LCHKEEKRTGKSISASTNARCGHELNVKQHKLLKETVHAPNCSHSNQFPFSWGMWAAFYHQGSLILGFF